MGAMKQEKQILRSMDQPEWWFMLGGKQGVNASRDEVAEKLGARVRTLAGHAHVGVFDSPVRVLIVDDHPLMRKMLREVLALDDQIEVVGSASNGDEALAALEDVQPDVIVLDYALPGANGIDVMEEIHERYGRSVLITSIYAQPYLIERARRAGALGYLPKISVAHSLARAVHTVSEGRSYFQA